ncbi:MAG: proteasome assembly chaperone family protein [Halobacteriaceae archaeon]
MAGVNVRTDVDLDRPVLVDGLPGVGLVGKIAADHIIEELDLTYFASVTCDGLPQVAVHDADRPDVLPPVRLYADATMDLVVLQSDVPVSRTAASDFAACVTTWLENTDGFPVYISGLPVENMDVEEVPSLYGVATGDGAATLSEHDIAGPSDRGVVGGPTGALLHEAADRDLSGVGLVVESDPQFPDPAAARKLIVDGVTPIAEVEVSTEDLVEQSEQIREQKQQLAQRMQEVSEEESSQARPMRMYQ